MSRPLGMIRKSHDFFKVGLYLFFVIGFAGLSNNTSSAEAVLFKKLDIKFLEFNKTLGEHESFIEVEPLRVGGKIIYSMVFGYSEDCVSNGRSNSVQQTFEINKSRSNKFVCQGGPSRNDSEITTYSHSSKSNVSDNEYRLQVKTSIDSRQGEKRDIITIENIEFKILVGKDQCRVESVFYKKNVNYFPGSKMNMSSESRSINFWSKCKIEN